MAFKKDLEKDFINGGRGEVAKNKSESKEKHNNVYLRFSEEERELFERLCAMNRMKFVQYIRYRFLTYDKLYERKLFKL